MFKSVVDFQFQCFIHCWNWRVKFSYYFFHLILPSFVNVCFLHLGVLMLGKYRLCIIYLPHELVFNNNFLFSIFSLLFKASDINISTHTLEYYLHGKMFSVPLLTVWCFILLWILCIWILKIVIQLIFVFWLESLIKLCLK